MVVGAVRPGCRRRSRHHLVLRAQGRFQGASQGRFTVKPSFKVILVRACVCVCVFKCFCGKKEMTIPKNLVLNVEQVK